MNAVVASGTVVACAAAMLIAYGRVGGVQGAETATEGGNYHDVMSGTTTPIQGAVDKQTQRLVWTVGDNKTTVGEKGIYNLTKDEAPALIHIGKDKTQQWTLVRLKQQPQQQQ
jgi:hypothetical protein